MRPTLLHVGCGANPLHPEMLEHYDEIRLDIDPGVQPDIVASMLDLGDIGPFDGIYTSHTLEHVFPHQVSQALAEFRRVLKPGGVAMVIVPDLEGIQATEEPIYLSPIGPVCGLDMIYGMRRLIERNPYMAHKCGFVRETLDSAMADAGFSQHHVSRTPFNLVAVAVA